MMSLGTVPETLRVVPKVFLHTDGMSVSTQGQNQASVSASMWSGKESPGQGVPQKNYNMGSASQRHWRS